MNIAYLLVNSASNYPDRIAVIGIPDSIWGESVKAFIVLKQGKMVDKQEIINFCKSHLASYKKPKAMEFVSSIPKNPSGKTLKRLLKEGDQKGGDGKGFLI